MSDTPETSPEKPKKKIITVGADRIASSSPSPSSGGERRGGERRGGKGGRGGRGRDEDDRRPAVPPALMRGPKPKPKAVEEDLPEVVADEVVANDEAVTNDAETSADNAIETVASAEAEPA